MLIDRFDWESAWIAVAADLGLGSQVVRRRRGPSQLQCVGFAQSSFFFFRRRRAGGKTLSVCLYHVHSKDIECS